MRRRKQEIKIFMTAKKILSLLLLLGTVAAIKMDVQAATYGDYEYEVQDDRSISIICYTGQEEIITMPSEIKGMQVKVLA